MDHFKSNLAITVIPRTSKHTK